MKNYKSILVILSIGITSCSSCKKDDDNATTTYQPGSVTLEYENVVNGIHVDISGGTNYKNAAGDSFNITLLKYYISNVELLKSDGSYYKVPESYYLINEANVSMHKAVMSDVPGGVYTGIRYMVGVDSTRNVSGAQTGALDVGNLMFWTWNSGYIFFKLEGTSPSAISGTNPTGDYTYHIGGFKQSTGANMRTITAAFGENLTVDGSREAEIHTTVDIQELFKNPVDISLAVDNDVMSPGPVATKIANNYVDMFQFEHIHNAK